MLERHLYLFKTTAKNIALSNFGWKYPRKVHVPTEHNRYEIPVNYNLHYRDDHSSGFLIQCFVRRRRVDLLQRVRQVVVQSHEQRLVHYNTEMLVVSGIACKQKSIFNVTPNKRQQLWEQAV